MENIIKSVKEYIVPPPEKTLTQKCTEFISNHPEIIYKGVPIAIVGWYAMPVIILGIQLAPWLYVGYHVQQNGIIAHKVYQAYNYSKSFFN